jgi:uncharacterized damage-inducible protein DinB
MQTSFRFFLAALVSSLSLAIGASRATAQTVVTFRTTSDVLREHEWADGINNLLDIVVAMPDSDFAFRPTSKMRSFGEIVGHITNVQFGFCDVARGITAAKRDDWEKLPSKADAIRGLRLSIAACDSAFDRLTDARLSEPASKTILADLFVTMLGHTRRETGKLVAYLPIRGVTPPEIHYQQGRKWRAPAK